MTNAELIARNEELEQQVLLLTQQLDYLKRQLFGRKSEQLDHPELFGPSAETEPGKGEFSGDAAASEDEDKAAADEKTRRRRKLRKERLPENLPVITEEVIPAYVAADLSAWHQSGFEECWQLEKEPGYYYLRHIKRLKFVPLDNPFAPPVIEPAKPTLIPGGFWGSGILAEVLANKYLYHIPFYRQHILNLHRYNVDLSESTMGDAADKIADGLAPLITRMKAGMLDGGVVCADETYIRYLDRIAQGGSSRGYFWVYRGLYGDVIFDWQTTREHRHVVDWLGNNFEGTLLSDGYEAYERYCELQRLLGKKVRRAACLAHIRRKFKEALGERPAVVRWILKIIARLYRTETMLRLHAASPEVRARVRQNNSAPLIRLLGRAFKHLRTTVILPKSRLGQALNYALGQWQAMQTFLEDGRIDIDNNRTENDIRPSAVGKKNWLFIGHPDAGRRAAILYTLLISARNHGVDPQAYLRDVIERMPSATPADLDALLPANWAAAHRATHPAAKPDRKKVA